MDESNSSECVFSSPPAFLAGHVSGYRGYSESVRRVIRRLEVPKGQPSLIVGFGEEVRISCIGADRNATPYTAFLVAPGGGSVIAEHDGTFGCIEVDLTARGAIACSGQAGGFGAAVISLEEFWGGEAPALCERLAASSGWSSRFALINSVLATKISKARVTVRPEIEWAWSEIKRRSGVLEIREIAASIGWSRRHFAKCFCEQTGLPPKATARLFRFQRARELASSSPDSSLCDIALVCGYSDQSHLSREFQHFARCSPAVYRAARFPDLPGVPADILGK